MAGYAVECALKACIAKLTRQNDFPDKKLANKSHTHNLIELVDVAQLKSIFDTERHSNNVFDINWNTVKSWSEEARYDASISSVAARDFFSAITDAPNGVLPWLKKYW